MEGRLQEAMAVIARIILLKLQVEETQEQVAMEATVQVPPPMAAGAQDMAAAEAAVVQLQPQEAMVEPTERQAHLVRAQARQEEAQEGRKEQEAHQA